MASRFVRVAAMGTAVAVRGGRVPTRRARATVVRSGRGRRRVHRRVGDRWVAVGAVGRRRADRLGSLLFGLLPERISYRHAVIFPGVNPFVTLLEQVQRFTEQLVIYGLFPYRRTYESAWAASPGARPLPREGGRWCVPSRLPARAGGTPSVCAGRRSTPSPSAVRRPPGRCGGPTWMPPRP